MIETRKRNATPAMDMLRFLPSMFCELMAASQINAIVIPAAPNRRGLRRPMRSTMKRMKTKSVEFCQCDFCGE